MTKSWGLIVSPFSILYFNNLSTDILPDQNRVGEEASRYCVFWDYSLQAWSGEGCRVDWDTSSMLETVCQCDHLTNFGLLFDINGVLDDWSPYQMAILSILTIVLCSLSILASLVTLLILQISRSVLQGCVPRSCYASSLMP